MALLLTSAAIRREYPSVSIAKVSAHELAPLVVAAGATVATSIGLDQVKAGKSKTVLSFIALGAGGAAAYAGRGEIVKAAGVGAFTGAFWSLFRKGGEGRAFLLPFG